VVSSADSVESGASSEISKRVVLEKLYVVGRNGVPIPLVVATAPSNLTTEPPAVRVMPPLIFRKPVQETQSEESLNPVVVSISDFNIICATEV